jgi:hypothetical protein
MRKTIGKTIGKTTTKQYIINSINKVSNITLIYYMFKEWE